MIASIITIFSLAATWLVSQLPAGPDPSAAASALIHSAVGFVKALDTIIDVNTEIAAVLAIVVWIIAKMAFRGVAWAYKRILK